MYALGFTLTRSIRRAPGFGTRNPRAIASPGPAVAEFSRCARRDRGVVSCIKHHDLHFRRSRLSRSTVRVRRALQTRGSTSLSYGTQPCCASSVSDPAETPCDHHRHTKYTRAQSITKHETYQIRHNETNCYSFRRVR